VRRALLVAVIALAGCGDDEEAAPAAWCTMTDGILNVYKFHGATIDLETAGDWTDGAPEQIRPSTLEAVKWLKRYPVQTKQPQLVQAMDEVRTYAVDRCPKGLMPAAEAAAGG
jgi:hypothetical protein